MSHSLITTILDDLDAGLQKAKAWAKTGWLAFEGFLKPLLTEIEQILIHIGETDALALGASALADLKSGKSEAEIIEGLKSGIKALVPSNVTAGEAGLLGVAGAYLASAKVTLAADPTQHTNS